MENPNTWDEHDKAMMAILDANRESEQQGVIGLSLHRKLGDYVRAALSEAQQKNKAGTGNNHDEFASDCFCDKCTVTQQAATISTLRDALQAMCDAMVDGYRPERKANLLIAVAAALASTEKETTL